MKDEVFIKGELTVLPPRQNFGMQMGEDSYGVVLEFTVTRNLVNRLKYWLFCKFFPFKIVHWDKDK